MTLVQNVIPAPLQVDLEGAVVPTNLVWEAVLRLVGQEQPVAALRMPFWALRGRQFFRRRLAERITLDPAALPVPAGGRRIPCESNGGEGGGSSDMRLLRPESRRVGGRSPRPARPV